MNNLVVNKRSFNKFDIFSLQDRENQNHKRSSLIIEAHGSYTNTRLLPIPKFFLKKEKMIFSALHGYILNTDLYEPVLIKYIRLSAQANEVIYPNNWILNYNLSNVTTEIDYYNNTGLFLNDFIKASLMEAFFLHKKAQSFITPYMNNDSVLTNVPDVLIIKDHTSLYEIMNHKEIQNKYLKVICNFCRANRGDLIKKSMYVKYVKSPIPNHILNEVQNNTLKNLLLMGVNTQNIKIFKNKAIFKPTPKNPLFYKSHTYDTPITVPSKDNKI